MPFSDSSTERVPRVRAPASRRRWPGGLAHLRHKRYSPVESWHHQHRNARTRQGDDTWKDIGEPPRPPAPDEDNEEWLGHLAKCHAYLHDITYGRGPDHHEPWREAFGRTPRSDGYLSPRARFVTQICCDGIIPSSVLRSGVKQTLHAPVNLPCNFNRFFPVTTRI